MQPPVVAGTRHVSRMRRALAAAVRHRRGARSGAVLTAIVAALAIPATAQAASVTLTASSANPNLSQLVTLTATTPISPAPYRLRIYEVDRSVTPNVYKHVASCPSTYTTCPALVTWTSASTHYYRAFIAGTWIGCEGACPGLPPFIQAASPYVTVTWGKP